MAPMMSLTQLAVAGVLRPITMTLWAELIKGGIALWIVPDKKLQICDKYGERDNLSRGGIGRRS